MHLTHHSKWYLIIGSIVIQERRLLSPLNGLSGINSGLMWDVSIVLMAIGISSAVVNRSVYTNNNNIMTCFLDNFSDFVRKNSKTSIMKGSRVIRQLTDVSREPSETASNSSNSNLLFSNKLTPPFRVGASRYQTVKGFNPKTNPREIDNSVIINVNFSK